MTRPIQKELEKHFFKVAAPHLKLPTGAIEDHGDKPDVIVRDPVSGKVLLGIELTSFYIEDGSNDSSEQRQSKRRQNVLNMAENECNRVLLNTPRLSLNFCKSYPIENEKEVAAKLVAFVSKLNPSDSGLLLRGRHKHIPELDHVFVQWNMNVPWQLNQVHAVNLMSKDQLQTLVTDKDNKAEKYRACPKLWLLVIIDFFDPAQDQQIDEKITSLRSEKFEKVILYKTIFKETKEIACHKVPNGD